MEAPGQEARAATAEVLQRFFEELRLARATELAQSGRWLEAEALLTNGREPESAKELDLLARIAAATRRYERAGIWWAAAHQKDPEERRLPQVHRSARKRSKKEDMESKKASLGLAWRLPQSSPC